MAKAQLSSLDKELQELALLNFEKFCVISGVDKKQALICIYREKGLSLKQISIALGIPRTTVQDTCIKCNIS